MNHKSEILILGAGIGGYETFRTLAWHLKIHHIGKKITIVDENNYFTFVPLLHEVASCSVVPSHCTIPLRELIQGTPHRFIRAKVEKIFPDQNKVLTSAGEVEYEYCVAAIGSGINYYGIAGARENTFNVRTLKEASRLRTSFIRKMETCQADLNMVIVGGGYTGVEVAGQFADLWRKHLIKLYPKKKLNISLIQNGPVLVPSLPERAQKIITNRLVKIGVVLHFNKGASEVKNNAVVLNGEEIKSDITVWSAGAANTADIFMAGEYCSNGRIPVNNFLQHENFPNFYAVGDIACVENNNYPLLGETAHKEGEYVARAISHRLCGETNFKPFKFKSLGTLMPIGEWFGVVIRGNFVFSGRLIWWLRRTVYLLFMPGFSRKLKIVTDWTLNLFGLKYIIDAEDQQ